MHDERKFNIFLNIQRGNREAALNRLKTYTHANLGVVYPQGTDYALRQKLNTLENRSQPIRIPKQYGSNTLDVNFKHSYSALELALVRYRQTGNPKFLDIARRILENSDITMVGSYPIKGSSVKYNKEDASFLKKIIPWLKAKIRHTRDIAAIRNGVLYTPITKSGVNKKAAKMPITLNNSLYRELASKTSHTAANNRLPRTKKNLTKNQYKTRAEMPQFIQAAHATVFNQNGIRTPQEMNAFLTRPNVKERRQVDPDFDRFITLKPLYGKSKQFWIDLGRRSRRST